MMLVVVVAVIDKFGSDFLVVLVLIFVVGVVVLVSVFRWCWGFRLIFVDGVGGVAGGLSGDCSGCSNFKKKFQNFKS